MTVDQSGGFHLCKVLPGTGTEEVDGIPVIGIMGCMMFEMFRSSVDFHSNEVTLAPDKIAKKL